MGGFRDHLVEFTLNLEGEVDQDQTFVPTPRLTPSRFLPALRIQAKKTHRIYAYFPARGGFKCEYSSQTGRAKVEREPEQESTWRFGALRHHFRKIR